MTETFLCSMLFGVHVCLHCMCICEYVLAYGVVVYTPQQVCGGQRTNLGVTPWLYTLFHTGSSLLGKPGFLEASRDSPVSLSHLLIECPSSSPGIRWLNAWVQRGLELGFHGKCFYPLSHFSSSKFPFLIKPNLLILFICVCTCSYVCVHYVYGHVCICMQVQMKARNQGSISPLMALLFFKTGSPTEPKTLQFIWTGWPSSSGSPCLHLSVLRLWVILPLGGFPTWGLGF